MVTINLHQPGGRINFSLEFPSAWDDLYPREVLEISKQLLAYPDRQEIARAEMLHFILEYRVRYYCPGFKGKLPKKWISLLDIEQTFIDGYQLLDFVYEKNTLTTAAEQQINLPGLIPCKTYGHENFDSITCGEFEDAQLFFNEFFEEPDALCLANLAAILWRKKGDAYIKYNFKTATTTTYNYPKKVKRFLKLAPQRLYAIFIWYAGCQNMLPVIFKTVYEKNADAKTSPGNDRLAFTKCIHAGAGLKNGSRQQIRMMKLYEFMYDMEMEAVKAKEMQEEYDKIK